MRTEVGTGENHTHLGVPSSLFLLRSYCKDMRMDETVMMTDFVCHSIGFSTASVNKSSIVISFTALAGSFKYLVITESQGESTI